MNRRTFLKGAAAALSLNDGARADGVTTAANYSGQDQQRLRALPQDDFLVPDWLRYAQAVYFDGYSPPVYPHIDEFDAGRLLQIVKSLGGDVLRFQPIGYWAYYPSKVFPVHEELGTRDLIDEVSRECRRLGVRQYCYTGYGAALMLTPEYLQKYPKYADWLLLGPDGKPYGRYGHNGWMTPLHRICATGDTYRDAIREVVKELCRHDIDGLYFDAPSPFGYSGICFCASCRNNFQKFSGIDLERLASLGKLNGLPFEWDTLPENVDMEALIAWYAWANELTKQDFLEFRKIIHSSGKFMFCHDGAWVGTSLPLEYQIPDGFMVEASRELYDRLMTGMMGASMTHPYKKVAQMYMGSYAVTWFGEPPHEQPGVVHNTNLEDSHEIRMEGFSALACGNTPLYATANRLYFQIGSGSAKPAQEVFDLMRRVKEMHADSVAVPYVTIVPTWGAQQLWQTKGKSWNWPLMSQGMGLAMLDERISFDIFPSTELTERWLAGQKVIALCGASGISKSEAEMLARWVEKGGGLLATYDSGLYDNCGKVHADGGALKQLLGVSINGKPLRSEPECFYRIKETHPALGPYGPGTVVEGDTRLLPVTVLPGARVLAESWNLGTKEIRGPAIVANSYGKGRTIYINGSIEAHYLYDRVTSSRELLRSIVEYLGQGLPQPFKLTAPQGVYGVLRRAPRGDLMLWILANVGFKDAAAGRMRQQYVPVTNTQIAIQIPDGKRIKEMHLIRSDANIPFREEDGYAVGTIPTIHIAEVVHIALT
jgi:hypothetical protein